MTRAIKWLYQNSLLSLSRETIHTINSLIMYISCIPMCLNEAIQWTAAKIQTEECDYNGESRTGRATAK
jgi:hypothetical protein